MRVLYWDIDGVLRDYQDVIKPALKDGKLERLLRLKEFDCLICVSGWSSLILDPIVFRSASNIERLLRLRKEVLEVFPDQEYFTERVQLTADNDNRGRHIDFAQDWFYIDDWAEEFFVKAHGQEQYESFVRKRILPCDPFDDGQPLLDFIDSIPAKSTGLNDSSVTYREPY